MKLHLLNKFYLNNGIKHDMSFTHASFSFSERKKGLYQLHPFIALNLIYKAARWNGTTLICKENNNKSHASTRKHHINFFPSWEREMNIWSTHVFYLFYLAVVISILPFTPWYSNSWLKKSPDFFLLIYLLWCIHINHVWRNN